ncbi:peroxisomal enoyl-CoA-hydratase [Coprinopsis sp. MPI-PUGE-AT-0042]|nr:peroxisomal enoyl-CoA-hydratase [Coprinopsis sp. MPI-PUGE-AT-0042]
MAAPDYKALTAEFKHIIVTLEGGVLTVLLNRAKERNTYTWAVQLELIKVFELADKDDNVRVVIVTAEHTAPAYCSGADISGGWGVLWGPDEEREGVVAHRDGGGQLSLTILACRKITIACVNGHAAGVGVTALQLPFDFRFIWEGAKVTLPFVRRGIVPEATSSYMLPRLIGHSRATSLLLTGSTFPATSPLLANLYHQIIPKREDVYPTVKAFALELAESTSQVSIAYAKGLMQHAGDSAEECHLNDSRAMGMLSRSNDAKEGVQSFFERRKPKFTDTLSKDFSGWWPWWKRLDVKHRSAKL